MFIEHLHQRGATFTKGPSPALANDREDKVHFTRINQEGKDEVGKVGGKNSPVVDKNAVKTWR